MNKRNLLILLCLLFFRPVLPVLSAQVLSLEDAVQIALANNEKIKQYQSRVEQKEYENLAAWGNFFPKINLDGTYTHLNDPLNIDLSGFKQVIVSLQASNGVEFNNIYSIIQTGVPLSDQQKAVINSQLTTAYDAAIPSFNMSLKKQDYPTVTFTGVMPLFYGGKLIAAKKYASLEEDAANIELQRTRDEVISEVTKTYFGVMLLSDVVKLRREVLETIGEHKAQAEKLLAAGIIPKYDLLRAEVAYSEAERNLFDDENNLSLAETALKSQMGVDDNNEYIIADSLHHPGNYQPLDYYIGYAESNQPVFRLLEVKKNSAGQKYNVELSNFLPKIGAFGKYELYPEYLSALEPRWAVGVKASISLFNGFSDYLNLQSASKLEEEVEHISEKTKRDIILYIRSVYKGIENADKKFNTLASDIDLAKENLRHAEQRFNTGMGTVLEVTDARVSYEKAEIERAQAMYEYYTNLNQLYFICGKPMEILDQWNLNGVDTNE